jgi:hypothetical protein
MNAAAGLAQFQDALVHALHASGSEATLGELASQPGFAVYRNTVMKGCIDALQANYPAVARLVGEEWFRAAAALYARANPPRSPMLFDYGAGFTDFLEGFGPAADLPYLPAVARLDRFWTESHVARDETPLGPGALAGIDAARLGDVVLRPHAAARWAWFPVPAWSIWSHQRKDAGESGAGPEIAWRDEGALIVRPGHAVHWLELDQAGCAFMDACAAGRPLAQAADAALAADPAADLAGLMARLIAAGAFARENR